MSLKIRLSRGGAKKRPFYRVVVADSRLPRDGRFIEKIGTFDPLKAKDAADRLVLDVEKAKAWIAKGAQPTDRVARLLDGLGVMKREAHNNPQEGASRRRRRRSAPAAAAKAAEAPRPPELAPDGEGPHSRRPIWRRAWRQRRAAAQILYAGHGGDRPLWPLSDASGARSFEIAALRPVKDDLFVARDRRHRPRAKPRRALTNVELYVPRDSSAAAGRGRILSCRSHRACGEDAKPARRSARSSTS